MVVANETMRGQNVRLVKVGSNNLKRINTMTYKVKLFEKRGSFIRYEIYKGKTKINQGWYKFWCADSLGEIAKQIEEMFNKTNM